jgi:hypothetical protein
METCVRFIKMLRILDTRFVEEGSILKYKQCISEDVILDLSQGMLRCMFFFSSDDDELRVR